MTTPSSASPSPANSGGPNQVAAAAVALGQSILGQITSTTQTIDNFLGGGINPVAQPPSLKTFVYSPEVKVIIAHDASGIQYDVSSDVVRCQLIRPENSAATFVVTLHNKDLRYTPPTAGVTKPLFSRMDRIVVYMKKTSWTQVFSGYLDTIPYRQLYPGTVDLKATCTIKRLMYNWMDPASPTSSALLNQITGQANADSTTPDSGLGALLRNVLIQVGGWAAEDIHIQQFPQQFLTFLLEQVQKSQQANAPLVQTLQHMLLGSDISPGPGAYAGTNPNAGSPGPSSPAVGGIPGASAGVADTLTMFYVQQIVAACDEKGLGPLVSDNNVAAGLVQAGQTGDSGGSPLSANQQKAFQQVQQTGLDAQQANRNSDAAILGVATAMADSGGGVGIRNLCNPAVPGSDQFPNDGPSFTGNCIGIFQQPDAAQWGIVSQRMNPKQAAGMYFAQLQALTGGNWRNMDPGAACSQVQNNTNSSAYTAAVPLATSIVQAYRTGSAGTASTVVGNTTVSTGMSASAVVGASPGTNPNLVVSSASASPSPVVNPGAVSTTRAGKPTPDSEGAINWAMANAMGKPYEWGGHGPGTFDCSGLVSAAFRAVGVRIDPQTDAIRGQVRQVYPNSAVQRGDIVEPTTGHVVLWCGDGTIIEAQQTGVPVHRVASWIGAPSSWAWVGRACLNGGSDITAPYTDPFTGGPGVPPGALDQVAGNGAGASGGVGEGVAHNLFSWMFNPGSYATGVSSLFTGEKAFIDGVPLLEMIQAIASGGLRSWSSAPNGDFMAWYPDYWGLDGTPAVLRLEDIELTDVNINFTDDALATHVYVAGDDTFTGQIVDMTTAWMDTTGMVTVEDADTWLYQRLIQIAPPDEQLSGDLLLRRYGIRPLKQTFAMAGDHTLEFLLATKVFMQKWAEQYKTDISMTFMPELFPGMRVDLAGKNLQVYVTSVTHVCDYEQGFSTTATIMAPSVPFAKKLMAQQNTTQPPSENVMTFAAGVNIFGGNVGVPNPT